jgi:mono/diheme cytochrome c family protein
MNGTAILPDAVLTVDGTHCASCHGDGSAYHLYPEYDKNKTSAEVYSCLELRE